MAKLADTAQLLEDLYYQNYKTDEDFFTMLHFKYMVGLAYSKILEDEYKEVRMLTLRETGSSDIILQSDWLETIEVEPKLITSSDYSTNDYQVMLPKRPFSFPYDDKAMGIQLIEGVEGNCNRFVRSSSRSAWKLKQLPKSDFVFWYSVGKLLVIKNASCTPKKLSIQMIPEVTEDLDNDEIGEIPRSKEEMILRRSLEIMKAARDGVIVDMTNNSNPNKTIQTEIDTTFGNLKTKPI